MRGKSLLNENAIIILSLNQSEWRKLLRSASSRIGVIDVFCGFFVLKRCFLDFMWIRTESDLFLFSLIVYPSF